MATFEISHKITAQNEGGYSNNPNDKGGETLYGIARNYNPTWQGWPIVDELKRTNPNPYIVIENTPQLKEMAHDFYKEKYWNPLKLDHFDQKISNELYDSSVNLGQGTAAKALQQALNIMNRNQKDYKDITVDGGVGQGTIQSYDSYMATVKNGRNTEKLITWLVRWINFFQMQVYFKSYGTDQEIFMPGWTERV